MLTIGHLVPASTAAGRRDRIACAACGKATVLVSCSCQPPPKAAWTAGALADTAPGLVVGAGQLSRSFVMGLNRQSGPRTSSAFVRLPIAGSDASTVGLLQASEGRRQLLTLQVEVLTSAESVWTACKCAYRPDVSAVGRAAQGISLLRHTPHCIVLSG